MRYLWSTKNGARLKLQADDYFCKTQLVNSINWKSLLWWAICLKSISWSLCYCKSFTRIIYIKVKRKTQILGHVIISDYLKTAQCNQRAQLIFASLQERNPCGSITHLQLPLPPWWLSKLKLCSMMIKQLLSFTFFPSII